jgi:adenylylsulfate kinase
MGETKIRSLVKAITWRMFSIFLGIGISMMFLRDLELVIKMNIIFVIVGTSCQYVHERLWNRVKWGIEINEKPSRDDEG